MSSQHTSPRANHPIFQAHPLSERRIASGSVTAPYHIYNGSLIFIGGSADADAVQTLLHDQQILPLRTTSGKAWMGIWIGDFTDANLGAHQELQVSFFVSNTAQAPVPDHPLELLKRMLLDPSLRMLCHGLWNNTKTVVAYNRELLHLDAHLTSGSIRSDASGKRTQFRFTDSERDSLLIEGNVTTPSTQGLRESLAFMRTVGVPDLFKALRAPSISVNVVNTISTAVPHQLTARTFTKSDQQGLRFFDPQRDSIHFGDLPYSNLGFEPRFMSGAYGVRFVYLEPQ